MNFDLDQVPKRTVKPRAHGLTMVMDKGLSLREAEDMLSVSGGYIDLLKLGFGTAYVTPQLDKKISLFKNAGIATYFGGTLLEAFLIRNQLDDYIKLVEKYKMEYVEISDGSIIMPHEKKLQLIRKLSKLATVITEVGSKEEGILIHPNVWISMMQKEIEAGAWKVIAEARESGTVGIFRPSGKAHVVLINKIIAKVPQEKIIWETPTKSQQAYFIKLLGANVNLGNIAPADVLPLETLRLGLRSDTFFSFLDNKNSKTVQ